MSRLRLHKLAPGRHLAVKRANVMTTGMDISQEFRRWCWWVLAWQLLLIVGNLLRAITAVIPELMAELRRWLFLLVDTRGLG